VTYRPPPRVPAGHTSIIGRPAIWRDNIATKPLALRCFFRRGAATN
jgi:hypothetical protein